MSIPDLSKRTKKSLKHYFPGLFSVLKRVRRGKPCNSQIKKQQNYHAGFEAYQIKILKPLQSDRKKILHVVANFWTGGSARLVVDLVEHLGHIYEQKVLTMDVPDVPAYTGLTVILKKERESRESILAELNRYNPDLVHIHYLGHLKDKWGIKDWQWYDNVFKALEEFDCKVVENINIPTHPYDSEVVSRYVYVSNYVREKYGQPHHRNEVIYPGTDFTHFKKPDLSNIPENCIGMVYRLERDKINEDSIEVFIKVIKQRKGTKALIVGGGSLLEHYKKAVEAAGLTEDFIFTGYVAYKDLPLYYKKLSVFIAPVHNESFGQVTPMAMNMGIPVAGYKVGALPEIISNESLLAPPGHSGKLAEIIIQLLDNREQRLKTGKKNHLRAKELFSVESMVCSYQKIYTELLTSDADKRIKTPEA